MEKVKFDFIKPNNNPKATIQKTGRLGFSSAMIEIIGIKKGKNRYIKVAVNAKDKKDNNIYLILSNKDDKEAFFVGQIGKYFYLRLKNFFDELNIDYSKTVIYDFYVRNDYYLLKPRNNPYKK